MLHTLTKAGMDFLAAYLIALVVAGYEPAAGIYLQEPAHVLSDLVLQDDLVYFAITLLFGVIGQGYIKAFTTFRASLGSFMVRNMKLMALSTMPAYMFLQAFLET